MLFKPASLSDWNLFGNLTPRSLWRADDTQDNLYQSNGQYPRSPPKPKWRSRGTTPSSSVGALIRLISFFVSLYSTAPQPLISCSDTSRANCFLSYPHSHQRHCPSPMSHHLWHRPRTADPDGTGHGTHKVSFSDSSKSSKRDSSRPSTNNSRPSSPRLLSPRGDKDRERPRSTQLWSDNRVWQRVNKQSEALWR